MNKTSKMVIKGSTILLSLVLLPSCFVTDFFKKKDESKKIEAAEGMKGEGAVLCSINGKPAIHEADLVKQINHILQSSPYFKGVSPDAFPASIKRKVFDELITQELIIADANKNNIESDAEFIKEFNEMKEVLKNSIKVGLFQKRLFDGIKIEQSEVEKFYNENKERCVKVAGGVFVSGIKFDQDAQAVAFLNSVKNKSGDFDKLAKENKAGKYKEFGRISKEARDFNLEAIPAPIKESALAANKFPLIEKVKAGKDFWVIKVADKKEAVYFTIDEMKARIEAELKNGKARDVLDAKIKAIREANPVVVNEDYFKEKNAPKEEPATSKEAPTEAPTEAPKEEAPVAA